MNNLWKWRVRESIRRHQFQLVVLLGLLVLGIHIAMQRILDIRYNMTLLEPQRHFLGEVTGIREQAHQNKTSVKNGLLKKAGKWHYQRLSSKRKPKTPKVTQKTLHLQWSGLDIRRSSFNLKRILVRGRNKNVSLHESQPGPLMELASTLELNASMFYGARNDLSPIIMHNPKLCQDGERNHSRPDLLVWVPSLLSHTTVRNTIRTTWASAAYNGGMWAGEKIKERMRLLFVFGAAGYSEGDLRVLAEEAAIFGDILAFNFPDTFEKLSIKIVMALHWTSQFCPGIEYILKADEDTFIHIRQLLQVTRMAKKMAQRFVLGKQHPFLSPPVSRDGSLKGNHEYRPEHFPRHLVGHAYVISGTAVVPLLQAYKTISILENEGAFVTGILAKLSNTTQLCHPSFTDEATINEINQAAFCAVLSGRYVSVTGCDQVCLQKLYHSVVRDECRQGTFKGFVKLTRKQKETKRQENK